VSTVYSCILVFGGLDGVRRVGRPKLRRENGVDQVMRILEVKYWKVELIKIPEY